MSAISSSIERLFWESSRGFQVIAAADPGDIASGSPAGVAEERRRMRAMASKAIWLNSPGDPPALMLSDPIVVSVPPVWMRRRERFPPTFALPCWLLYCAEVWSLCISVAGVVGTWRTLTGSLCASLCPSSESQISPAGTVGIRRAPSEPSERSAKWCARSPHPLSKGAIPGVVRTCEGAACLQSDGAWAGLFARPGEIESFRGARRGSAATSAGGAGRKVVGPLIRWGEVRVASRWGANRYVLLLSAVERRPGDPQPDNPPLPVFSACLPRADCTAPRLSRPTGTLSLSRLVCAPVRRLTGTTLFGSTRLRSGTLPEPRAVLAETGNAPLALARTPIWTFRRLEGDRGLPWRCKTHGPEPELERFPTPAAAAAPCGMQDTGRAPRGNGGRGKANRDPPPSVNPSPLSLRND
eukprot:Hpha_TRINITY_DN8773_c0_g1::TRINITY_DN8773_c0_g1_i1::g.45130::m.45130